MAIKIEGIRKELGDAIRDIWFKQHGKPENDFEKEQYNGYWQYIHQCCSDDEKIRKMLNFINQPSKPIYTDDVSAKAWHIRNDEQ